MFVCLPFCDGFHSQPFKRWPNQMTRLSSCRKVWEMLHQLRCCWVEHIWRQACLPSRRSFFPSICMDRVNHWNMVSRPKFFRDGLQCMCKFPTDWQTDQGLSEEQRAALEQLRGLLEEERGHHLSPGGLLSDRILFFPNVNQSLVDFSLFSMTNHEALHFLVSCRFSPSFSENHLLSSLDILHTVL